MCCIMFMPDLKCQDCLQYEEGSAPALALKATIERTEKRFKNYADAGLLCGTDGLPHLISDPGLALRYGHTGETLVRSILSCTYGESMDYSECLAHAVRLAGVSPPFVNQQHNCALDAGSFSGNSCSTLRSGIVTAKLVSYCCIGAGSVQP